MLKADPDINKYREILGLDNEAGPGDIKRSYRQLAKKYHPDINSAPDAHDRFIEITEAYEILINRSPQTLYDEEVLDPETLRAEYEKARKAAKESARRYARMKFEKFKLEQEAFKKSGWHDVFLTFKYLVRILILPLTLLFIAMPLISEQVAEHPSGYVMFWLFASMLLLFVVNNRKGYFRLDPYYYGFAEIGNLIRKAGKITEQDCYYCKDRKSMSHSHSLTLFRIKNIQLYSYGTLPGRAAGINRDIKTVNIPRSRKAFTIHSICSIIKILSIVTCLVFIRIEPWSHFSLPTGIALGSLLSLLLLTLSSTKPKSSYLLNPGMMIKILIWLVCIYFLQGYAALLLFFDPMIEATLRFISRDNIFIPVVKQHPEIETLLRNRYQFYLELPIWSVINPFFRWLL
jgi:hypothetical protein